MASRSEEEERKNHESCSNSAEVLLSKKKLNRPYQLHPHFLGAQFVLEMAPSVRFVHLADIGAMECSSDLESSREIHSECKEAVNHVP